MTSLTITLPLPPKQLWQNWRGHWATEMRYKRDYRESARLKSLSKIGRREAPKWTSGEIRTSWYWPDKRRRDPMNAMAALKAAIDGMVDAGVMADDDKLMPGPTEFGVDKERPRVEITITPKGANQ